MCIFLCFCFVVCVYALSVNFYVIGSSKKQIVSLNEVGKLDDVDAVLVLGCGINADNTPSDMLSERLEFGVSALNKCKKTTKLLLTGDNSGKQYNEVGVMKKVCLSFGVDKKRIIEDGAGYSTYESIYNAAKDFDLKKIIIVTQSYHLPRALFIARKLGIEAYGVEAYLRAYPKQLIWSAREVLARNKDFIKTIYLNSNGGE